MYDRIDEIHLELTNKCQASCPQCSRNNNGGAENPLLSNTEWSLERFKKYIDVDTIRGLKRLLLCGNYGEPIMCKELSEIVSYARLINPDLKINLNTNGSARNELFWKELARLKVNITFSIDGLEDTNHIYRRGCRWDIIMQSVKTFIDDGGIAEWDFLVFKHNEHQVKKARALAFALGFNKFNLKKTVRFLKTETIESYPVKDIDGNIEYNLELPTNSDYINEFINYDTMQMLKVDDWWKQTEVSCKVKENKSIYIDADANVFPCCWIGGKLNAYSWETNNLINNDVVMNFDKKELNLEFNDFDKIINGTFFKKIEDGFENKDCRFKSCGVYCSKNLNHFAAQFG